MRTINVTTDVYAAIWAARQPGEDTEADILARVLNAKSATPPPAGDGTAKVGMRIAKFDLDLPEGFEIFRTHKGTEYRANATNGYWKLANDGQVYTTLNQLSLATSGNTENAWRNWYFKAKDGRNYLVEKLRNDITPNVRHLL